MRPVDRLFISCRATKWNSTDAKQHSSDVWMASSKSRRRENLESLFHSFICSSSIHSFNSRKRKKRVEVNEWRFYVFICICVSVVVCCSYALCSVYASIEALNIHTCIRTHTQHSVRFVVTCLHSFVACAWPLILHFTTHFQQHIFFPSCLSFFFDSAVSFSFSFDNNENNDDDVDAKPIVVRSRAHSV